MELFAELMLQAFLIPRSRVHIKFNLAVNRLISFFANIIAVLLEVDLKHLPKLMMSLPHAMLQLLWLSKSAT